MERYSFKRLGDLLLFPYRRAGGEMRLMAEAELGRYPRIAKYLREHEDNLRQRDGGKMDRPEWYAFARNQNLALHDGPKLGVAATVPRLEVAADLDGGVYFHNVRVNGILPRQDGPGLCTLLALLNSKLLDWVFKLGAAEHANGYFAANKQFIAPLPIRLPGTGVDEELSARGRSLHESTNAVLREREGFLAWLSDTIGVSTATLSGQTKLQRPEVLLPGELLAILRANRKELSLDPAGRSFGELLKREHAASRDRITELATAVERDEEQVDDAVFDLYEVTAGHRAMVESSYSGK